MHIYFYNTHYAVKYSATSITYTNIDNFCKLIYVEGCTVNCKFHMGFSLSCLMHESC